MYGRYLYPLAALVCLSLRAQDYTITGGLKAPEPDQVTPRSGTILIRYKPDPGRFSRDTRLDSVTGTFQFTHVGDGTYELAGIYPDAEAYLPGCAEVKLPPNPPPLKIGLVRPEPQAAKPHQLMQDARKRPLADFTFRWVPRCYDWTKAPAWLETDQNGYVDFPALPLPVTKLIMEKRPGAPPVRSGPEPEDFLGGPHEQTQTAPPASETPAILKPTGGAAKTGGVPLFLPNESLDATAWTVDLAHGTVSPDVSLTAGQKLKLHAKRLYYPSSILLPAVVAITNQARYKPVEWGQGGIALTERFASAYGYNVALRNAFAFAIDSTLHLDPRYHPSTRPSRRGRLADALLQTLITYKDDGSKTFSFWRFGSAYGAGFVSNTWYPPDSSHFSDGLIRGSTALGLDTAANVLREFTPSFTGNVRDDLDRESAQLQRECAMGRPALPCAGDVLGGDPARLVLGQLGGGSRFGFGALFAMHNTSPGWQLTTNLYGLGTTNASANAAIHVRAVRAPAVSVAGPAVRGLTPSLELNFYTEATKLNDVAFYGVGPDTPRSTAAFFSLREYVTGGNLIWPIGRSGAAVYVEGHQRYIGMRSAGAENSIFRRYTEESAPGLLRHPTFFQTGEGLRFDRNAGSLSLAYSAVWRQFVSISDSHYSFQRATIDLRHEVSLYAGPPARRRYGLVRFQALLIDSWTGAGRAIPFFFQPTLGGVDANGNIALESYADYRFRAPDLLLFQAEVEHAVRGPVHAVARAGAGQVGNALSDLNRGLRASYSAGLRIRVPRVPVFTFLFAWGGGEGTHAIGFLDARSALPFTPASLY